MTNVARRIWYGLRADGSQVSISHEKLMEWAYRNDQQFNVGWSHAVTLPDGTRLARTRDAAAEKGWDDITRAPFEEVVP